MKRADMRALVYIYVNRIGLQGSNVGVYKKKLGLADYVSASRLIELHQAVVALDI